MHTFHTRIATLDKTLHEGEAVHCRVRTEIGSLGFKARHEPFLASLEPGSSVELRDVAGKTHTFPVHEGLLNFRDNRCLILLTSNPDRGSAQE